MSVTILPFAPEHAEPFKRYNWQWIEQYFSIEPSDERLLGEPQKYIIDPGGEIWMAALDGEVIGACALLPFAPGIFEFTKLGIDEKARGKGIARLLLRHCRDRAKARGAHTLKIFTNTKLAPACALYRSEGFTEKMMNDEERARYKRGDIMFDLPLL